MKNFCIRSDNVRQTLSFVFLPSFFVWEIREVSFSVYFKLNFPLAQVNQSDCDPVRISTFGGGGTFISEVTKHPILIFQLSWHRILNQNQVTFVVPCNSWQHVIHHLLRPVEEINFKILEILLTRAMSNLCFQDWLSWRPWPLAPTTSAVSTCVPWPPASPTWPASTSPTQTWPGIAQSEASKSRDKYWPIRGLTRCSWH